jgi:hypothetical protein
MARRLPTLPPPKGKYVSVPAAKSEPRHEVLEAECAQQHLATMFDISNVVKFSAKSDHAPSPRQEIERLQTKVAELNKRIHGGS